MPDDHATKDKASCASMPQDSNKWNEIIQSFIYVDEVGDDKRGKNLTDGLRYIEESKDKTYKFSDVFFKSISWLITLSVIEWFWIITRYGIFIIILLAGCLIFSIFVYYRISYALSIVLRRFGVGPGKFRPYLLVIFFGIPVLAMTIATFRIVPTIVRKMEYAAHAHGIDCSLHARGGAANPISTKQTENRHP